MTRETMQRTAEATPSAAAILAYLSGVELQQWLSVLGIVFLLLQITHFIWKWAGEIKARRMGEKVGLDE